MAKLERLGKSLLTNDMKLEEVIVRYSKLLSYVELNVHYERQATSSIFLIGPKLFWPSLLIDIFSR